jgi:hypothetical protein
MSLDVIIRTHDPARGDELNRAVFSAALQDVSPVTIHVVCQRFSAATLDAVRLDLAPIFAVASGAALDVLNRPDPLPGDARAALLNVGLQAAQGRYVAFLDYDDLIYPEGWRLLIDELEASGAAVAFGAVLNASVSRDGLVPHVTAKRRVFEGDGLRRLLWNNFCPLHSFVLDRSRLPANLAFDEGMAALEDYDLLLRIVSQHRSSFRLKDKLVGEYLLKDDGSNLNPIATAALSNMAWDAALAEVEARKLALVLSPAVQAQLGIDEPGLTVAAFLARQTGLG